MLARKLDELRVRARFPLLRDELDRELSRTELTKPAGYTARTQPGGSEPAEVALDADVQVFEILANNDEVDSGGSRSGLLWPGIQRAGRTFAFVPLPQRK